MEIVMQLNGNLNEWYNPATEAGGLGNGKPIPSILEHYIMEAIIIESKFLGRQGHDRSAIAKRVSEIIANGEVATIAHHVSRAIDLLHEELKFVWEAREGGFVNAYKVLSDLLSSNSR